MLNSMLANFYERDIRRLIEEVNLFRNEEDLWKTHGSIKNPAGNLILHVVGGLNHLIGSTLAQTGYVRKRDQEFTDRGVSKEELIAQLEKLIALINETLNSFTAAQMEDEYPIFFDQPKTSVNYVLVQLLIHLNYHLGQVNYLRRMLE